MNLTILIGAYGDFPQYTLRCIGSILAHAAHLDRLQIHVGCGACSEAVTAPLQSHFHAGRISSLFLSRKNINKDPMMRILLQRVDTDFFLWLDDDSHFTAPGWASAMFDFIRRHPELDVAGHVFFHRRGPEYEAFLKARPWFSGVPLDDPRVFFATGGAWLARTRFLLENGWPDHGMVKKQDDILLGDLCNQRGGNLVDFGHDRAIMDKLKISDGARRGEGEGADGWKS